VLIESGVDISPVITHRFEVDQFEDAFEATASHESGKVLIRWAEPE
jgi:threonine 3-dehydrogenase